MGDLQDFDHVVLGSTPLALLLAGLLAGEHRQRVCVVGTAHSAFRLPHGFDLGIDVVVRPDTLMLLQVVADETVRLVTGLGKTALERIDPLFVAETPDSAAALEHFRHLALALGYDVQPVIDRSLSNRPVCRVRDVPMLVPGEIDRALEAWVDGLGVRRLPLSATEVRVQRDGRVRLVRDGIEMTAPHAILADDAAVLAHLPDTLRDRMLDTVSRQVLLTEPSRAVPGPLLHWLDRGVSVWQAGRDGIAAVALGDADTATARIGASIATAGPLKRAGEAREPALVTADAAPYFAMTRTRATALAGFGQSGAFLAPAMARQVMGRGTADENAWFGARGPSRGRARSSVTDIAMVRA